MNRLVVFLFLCATVSLRAQVQTEEAQRPGILQLTDGSILHGALNEIDATNRLVWKHPAAKKPLQFALNNMASLRFDDAVAQKHSFTPNARFQFKNGDELVGNVRAIKDNTLRFESWFGDNVQANLGAVEAIMFSARGYHLLYEGPTGTNGWRIGRNPRSWEYKDGAFIANGADLLGRDFALTNSSTLEFDLAWNGAFSLSITLYAQVIDRFDYSNSAYLVYLGTGAISVQRVQAGSGAVMLGQNQIPEMYRKNKMRFEIRCNKEDATITLLADGKFVQRWKDNSPGGFVAKGGGIVFYSQVEAKSLRISNIRVAEWDGRYEPESMTNLPPEMDVIFLANRDKVFGKVLGLEESKTTVETKQTKLDIPLERVTQIRFAKDAAQTNVAPGAVRASFPNGESVVFNLEKWSSSEVKGTSETFGALTFDPKNIRGMEFNLNRVQSEEEGEGNLDAQFLEVE